MSIQEQVKVLIEARNLVNVGLAPVLEALKDTSIPLEERWAAYTDLVDNDVLTDNDSYGDGEIYILDPNATLYDDFTCERYQTMKYIDMYDLIMEADPESEWEASLVAMKPNLPVWQEEVLKRGKASFTHDW